MKAFIFNGALERRQESTSGVLSNYFAEQLNQLGVENSVFNLADSGIPLFDTSLSRIPNSVKIMNNLFLEADLHFWLSPLYHGSVPG
ncbi:NAD(P)H-dependent oxidoreductase [Sphingobacterium sp. E70]|nr:NAD(P)H-dependent oxidoreductase [Sphingobacterium sp. E70]ULT26233.1 NAD(P)H-dependent oxidoreductase [Sphingobacterium sp. E70]